MNILMDVGKNYFKCKLKGQITLISEKITQKFKASVSITQKTVNGFAI